ncbi:E3 SUMO-protein ligase RanBP2 [Chironomus tepperi]|uniref:E3 SUMO-protein ligase RanBP2 n=1 Tax=Chironomus tepperi TaxID=113505 RepID=UPI00391FA4B7
MIKFNSKRDVDRHVSQMSQKLNENERSSRGFAIAKSYAKVNEYELAKDWLQRYLEIKPDDAAAYKFMGEVYEKLQKPEQAITNFQQSYSLNSKQSDIIKSVCRLFLLNDGWSTSPAKAKYWCELAETENIRDDNVFTLRLKMSNKDKTQDNKPAEDMILREITARPHDVGLRIRLVKFLLEEKRFKDALKYCFDLEMKFMETFISSIEWYNTISNVLNYSDDTWNYWCLLLISLEKQIFLNLKKDTNLQAIKQTNIKEVTNLLFEFDQAIRKASDILLQIGPVKEFGEELINHFCGQLALHIASLLFQKQKIANNDQWRETTKKCLPFLLFAFQSSTVNTEASWLKNMNETIRNLFNHLKKEGAFRCTQSARTILSCKTNRSDDVIQTTNQKYWFTIDDIFNQVRETCADLNWRKIIFRSLFANTDHQMKISSSYYVQSSYFQEPNYEMISFNDIENYENIAQHLYPSCLDHQVYLGLGRTDLHTFKVHTFSGLNLSASNLINCNPETINLIDIDSFLYCAIIQAKRKLEAEKKSFETFNNRLNEKPLILPASNIVDGLCTEEQNYWWLCAYKMYKNINFDNLAQLKATLQFGIEAVRGIDSPKIDLIILLKLGDILLSRSCCCKPDEKRHLEIRVEYIYKFAMKMMKNHEGMDNTRRLFKFITNNYDVYQELEQLTGAAIGYLSGVYFRRDEYKEFIDELTGIQNIWAHFFRSEAYRKLDELGKSPRKAKKFYIEKARESLIETLSLLDKNENIYKDNPLRMRVEKDLKKLQYDLSTSFSNNEELDFQNTSQNGYADDEIFHNASSSSFRGRRDFSTYTTATYNEKLAEIESLTRKLNDIMISVKDDILSVRNDITSLKDDVLNIRGDITDLNVNKDATTSKALNDIYKSLEDMPWNITYMMNMVPNQTGPVLSSATRFPGATQFNQMYNTAYPIYPMQYPVAPSSRPPFTQISSQINYAADSISFNPSIPSQQQSQLSNAGPKSMLLEALNTPNVLNTWNNTYNSSTPTIPLNLQLSNNFIGSSNLSTSSSVPVNKESLPINVVITSSDPLPTPNTIVSQPTLSVTIPPQHIKHSQNDVPIQQIKTTNSNLNYENVSPSKQNDSELYEEPSDYDPRPDFKPIIPLPDEVEIKTGEENEEVLFEERAKLFRFVDKEWKERGLGNIKILKNKSNNKCRIVMRREQIHKLCANHAITSEMELKTTQNETNLIWGANDYTEEEMKLEKFLVRFKYVEQAKKFSDIFELARKLANSEDSSKEVSSNEKSIAKQDISKQTPNITFAFGGQTGNLTKTEDNPKEDTVLSDKNKSVQPSPFANFSFGGSTNKSFTELFSNLNASKQEMISTPEGKNATSELNKSLQNDDEHDNFEPTAHFEPVIPLPELIENKTGEEDERVLFYNRAKLLRFDSNNKEWKERGIGEMKVLVKKDDPSKGRLLMRREQVFKLCCNMPITNEMKFSKMNSNALSFAGQDFSDGEMKAEKLAIKFKTPELIKSFQIAVSNVQEKINEKKHTKNDDVIVLKKDEIKGFGDLFKPKIGSWTCEACYISNKPETLYCVACETPKDSTIPKKEPKSLLISSNENSKFCFGMPNQSGFSFGMPVVSTVSTSSTISNSTENLMTTGFVFGTNSNNSTSTSISNNITSKAKANSDSEFKFDTSKPFSFGNLPSENASQSIQKVQFSTNPSVKEIGKNDAGFNFIFKKKSPAKEKSPGKSRNNSVNSEGHDEAGDDNEYHEEEENQTYFTPVIPLPDKIEIKTGEENEKVLYSHRAKLFRFIDKEWKERGLGDVKILQHNETGKLRMVMRREQVHKICLNIFLTAEVEFKRKDDQSWTFGANDFSEGEYELTSFAIRFKSKDICDAFKKAIDDALTKKLSVSNDNSEIIKKLMLPEDFFSYENGENCSGCLGCKSDDYIYNAGKSDIHEKLGNDVSLPLFSPSIITRSKSRGASQEKKVSFKIAEIKENDKIIQLFAKDQNDGEKSNTNEKKKSEQTGNIFRKFNNQTQNIHGDDKNIFGTAGTSVFSSSLNTGTTKGLDSTNNEQICIFGSKTNFGNANNGSSIFSSGNKENNDKLSFANTPLFGANIFGSINNSTAHSGNKGGLTNIFGTSNSTFSFADAAKELEDKSKKSFNEPDFLKNINNKISGFAELAASSSTANTVFNVQKNNGTGQFFGLTVKDDFFSKNLNKQNTSTEEPSHNDDENVQDDNYDPHYDPIISLPDEVKVCTGEEDEEKLFGERAKLFRYDMNTKEWKERGVGEMKILHHSENKTYRMILRREQIFKLVLNQLVTSELHISSMENSSKAFCWVGMNYAESIDGEVEQLAVRFKNEELASNFKKIIEKCQGNM